MLTALAVGLALAVAAEERAVDGVVKDATTGAPIASARVAGGGREAATDAGGRFHLSLAVGPARVTVTAPGYDDATVLVDPASASIEVALTPRARFREEVEVTATRRPSPPAVLPVRRRQVMTVAGAPRQHLPRHPDPARRRGHRRDRQPPLRARGRAGREPHHHGRGRDPQPLPPLRAHQRLQPGDGRPLRVLAGRVRRRARRPPLVAAGGGEPRRHRQAELRRILGRQPHRRQRGPGREAPRPQGVVAPHTRRTYYDLVAERFVDADLPAFRDIQLKAAWQPREGQKLSLTGVRSREDGDGDFDGDVPGERGDFLLGVPQRPRRRRLRRPRRARALAHHLAWYDNRSLFDAAAIFRSDTRRANTPTGRRPFAPPSPSSYAHVIRDLSAAAGGVAAPGDPPRPDTGFELHRLRAAITYRDRGPAQPAAGQRVQRARAGRDCPTSSRAPTATGAAVGGSRTASASPTASPWCPACAWT